MAVPGVSEDVGKSEEIASGESGSERGAGNQTPLACTPWAWLAQKREPNAPLVTFLGPLSERSECRAWSPGRGRRRNS
jgi:hypothetical protein